eukprot:SM000108S14244  [mRNA]  locus=s108:446195:448513:- [translate_table: standard]
MAAARGLLAAAEPPLPRTRSQKRKADALLTLPPLPPLPDKQPRGPVDREAPRAGGSAKGAGFATPATVFEGPSAIKSISSSLSSRAAAAAGKRPEGKEIDKARPAAAWNTPQWTGASHRSGLTSVSAASSYGHLGSLAASTDDVVCCEEELSTGEEDDDNVGPDLGPTSVVSTGGSCVTYSSGIRSRAGSSAELPALDLPVATRCSQEKLVDSLKWPASPTTASSQAFGVYEEDIHAALRAQEEKRGAVHGYLAATQHNLTAEHRRLMVKWLLEFSQEFKLEAETLFMGVALLDRYLHEGPKIRRSMLQLLGIASIIVAAKFQETQITRIVRDSCELGEHTFSIQQVIDMEASVLEVLRFDILTTTSLTFLWQYLRVLDCSAEIEQRSRTLLCLSLSDYDVLQHRPSMVAASAILVAGYLCNEKPWNTAMKECSDYKAEHLRACAERLHALHLEMNSRGVLDHSYHNTRSVVRKCEETARQVNKKLPNSLFYQT